MRGKRVENIPGGESVEQGKARVLLSPDLGAAATLRHYLCAQNPPDITALTAELQRQVEAVSSGDLTRAEEMLCAQAHVLDQIFNALASRAILSEQMPHLEAYLRLALKAQGQARSTWEAVSAIQNPPIAGYITQANIAVGHQQINNGGSRTRENETEQSKLLEQTDGNRLEFGAAGTASAVDPRLEAVGAVNRSQER